MRCKYKKIVLLISSIFMFMFLSVLTTACSRNVKLENFSASDRFFVVGKNVSITFTVEAKGVNVVDLCADNDEIVERMKDDGKNGDLKAHDGVYTCVVEENEKSPITTEYYAKYRNLVSEKIQISYFEKPGENAQQEYLNVKQEIDKIDEKYLNENGYVDPSNISKVVAEVAECAEELLEEGEIIEYEKTENSVTMKLSSGLTKVYVPETEGTYGIGKDVPMEICIYQPYYTWVRGITDKYISLPAGVSNEADLLMEAATTVESSFANYNFSQDSMYLDDEVTLATIKGFGANQIILWQGHGCYAGKYLHSIVMTGEAFDMGAYLSDAQYYEDCVEGRIVDCEGTASISYKFIDTYCTDLDNSFIYLGPCQSGYDDVLANSFLNKGAEAVIANTDTILCLYGDMIEYTTTYLMSQINQDTKDYYTLSEALQEAKELYGESDAEYGGVGAVPTIFGGKEADNFQLRTYAPTYVQDFSVSESQVLTIGEINVIEPVLIPEDADNYDITWESSDESVVSVTGTGDGGIVHGKSKGTAVITATLISGGKTLRKSTNLRVASKARDTILVLDVSGSMDGRPMEEMKEAATDFCEELLQDTYSNRVGLVFYDEDISQINLTNSIDALVSYIEDVDDGGTTNMEGAIAAAKHMLDIQGKDDSIKNIVVMADGLPNEGKTSSTGPMQHSSMSLYSNAEYANAVIKIAQEAMQSYNMYSLGFFHDLSGTQLDFATELMKYLTNQTDGYHQVEDASQLQFAFGDISEEISDGSKIIVNIACPVDVFVTYEDETLSSEESSFNDRTSFGTLQLLGAESDIKVLCLKPEVEYEIKINGTGVGEMHYSVNYLDENENVTDSRIFPGIPITPKTQISSQTIITDNDMELNVDKDGDGEIDTIWTASPNDIGEVSYEKAPEKQKKEEKKQKPKMEWDFWEFDMSNIALAVIGIWCVVITLGAVVLIVVGFASKSTEENIEMESVNEQDKTPEGTPSISILSGSLAGTEIVIKNQETVYLGKDAKYVNIVFTNDYMNISRIHCSIYYDEKYKKYFVTDSSSNGVYFSNMDKLKKGKRTAVERGTILLLANENAKIKLN